MPKNDRERALQSILISYPDNCVELTNLRILSTTSVFVRVANTYVVLEETIVRITSGLPVCRILMRTS